MPLGAQLRKKVKAGRITQDQAQKTAYERSVLAQAFGKDWRTKVYGKGGAKGASGPFAASKVRTDRAQALAKAEAKLKGGVGPAKARGVALAPSYLKPLTPPKRGLGPLPLKKRKLKY